jgi:hypothetical protein
MKAAVPMAIHLEVALACVSKAVLGHLPNLAASMLLGWKSPSALCILRSILVWGVGGGGARPHLGCARGPCTYRHRGSPGSYWAGP